MNNFLPVLLATSFVSLGGFLGVLTLAINKKHLKSVLQSLVAVAAGAMIGSTFLHILPEVSHTIDHERVFPLTLAAFILFLFIEKILLWRHCHQEDCEVHSFGYMNLLGDAIHNFVDGAIIAAAFQVNMSLGIATTVAVSLHEIPQEISDFGVLLYAGFKRGKALLFNVLVAAFAILGGVFGLVVGDMAESITAYLLILAAGSFLYVSTSDLIPRLRDEKSPKRLFTSFALFLLGVGLIAGLSFFEPEHQDGVDPQIDTPARIEH